MGWPLSLIVVGCVHVISLHVQTQGEGTARILGHDACHAYAAFEGAPEDIDVTVFPSAGPAAVSATQGAAALVREAHDARQFTDTGSFTLRCGVCQIGVKGEKEAVEHAKQTGHQNFSEYH